MLPLTHEQQLWLKASSHNLAGARVVHAIPSAKIRDGYIIQLIRSRKGKTHNVNTWSDIGHCILDNPDSLYRVHGIDSTRHEFSEQVRLSPGLFEISQTEDVDPGVRVVIVQRLVDLTKTRSFKMFRSAMVTRPA